MNGFIKDVINLFQEPVTEQMNDFNNDVINLFQEPVMEQMNGFIKDRHQQLVDFLDKLSVNV